MCKQQRKMSAVEYVHGSTSLHSRLSACAGMAATVGSAGSAPSGSRASSAPAPAHAAAPLQHARHYTAQPFTTPPQLYFADSAQNYTGHYNITTYILMHLRFKSLKLRIGFWCVFF